MLSKRLTRAFMPVLTVALLCTACSGKKTEKTENAVPATFTTDSVAETDSIAVGKSSTRATITMLYPADGPKNLVDSVRMWINNRLGLKDTIIADGAKVARLALVQQLDSNKVDLAGMTKDFPDYQTQYVTLWEISPVFETGKVLTYAGSIYTYTGGAHGSTVSFGSTFRTDNGKALGWDMFRSDSLVAIKNMVKEAIKTQYFKAGNNFSDYLLVKENEFPLPQTAPRFVKDGIEFIYQQYEIAPYAAGMPSCVLPYPTLIPSDYRHKKQSGGAGQFGEVHLIIEPYTEGMPAPDTYRFGNQEYKMNVRDTQEIPLDWGGKLVVHNCIVGGAIDARFIPAIVKGLMDRMEQGPLTGSYARDVRVCIYDGKMHPVDSNEISFRLAGRNAFSEAFRNANPKILEPVYDVDVMVPADAMGDVMSDLQGRRAIIMGMSSENGFEKIQARVPLKEMSSYSTALSSITGGRSSFSMRFSSYELVPTDVQEKLLKAYSETQTDE